MKQIIHLLNKMKKEGVIKNYAIGGATALIYYFEPIQTQDIDVFVRLYFEKTRFICEMAWFKERLRNMKNEQKYISNVKKAKRALKKELISLSYIEKIKRVIEMQKTSKKFKKDKSIKVYVWRIEWFKRQLDCLKSVPFPDFSSYQLLEVRKDENIFTDGRKDENNYNFLNIVFGV